MILFYDRILIFFYLSLHKSIYVVLENMFICSLNYICII